MCGLPYSVIWACVVALLCDLGLVTNAELWSQWQSYIFPSHGDKGTAPSPDAVDEDTERFVHRMPLTTSFRWPRTLSLLAGPPWGEKYRCTQWIIDGHTGHGKDAVGPVTVMDMSSWLQRNACMGGVKMYFNLYSALLKIFLKSEMSHFTLLKKSFSLSFLYTILEEDCITNVHTWFN